MLELGTSTSPCSHTLVHVRTLFVNSKQGLQFIIWRKHHWLHVSLLLKKCRDQSKQDMAHFIRKEERKILYYYKSLYREWARIAPKSCSNSLDHVACLQTRVCIVFAISDAHILPCHEDTRVPPFLLQYQGQGDWKGREKTFSLVPSLRYSMHPKYIT